LIGHLSSFLEREKFVGFPGEFDIQAGVIIPENITKRQAQLENYILLLKSVRTDGPRIATAMAGVDHHERSVAGRLGFVDELTDRIAGFPRVRFGLVPLIPGILKLNLTSCFVPDHILSGVIPDETYE
jgi:hypothetical protein